eukprot:845641-Pleurochrysis_carterae.AAC.1
MQARNATRGGVAPGGGVELSARNFGSARRACARARRRWQDAHGQRGLVKVVVKAIEGGRAQEGLDLV